MGRTVLCAATQIWPPAAKMSQGPVPVALPGPDVLASRMPGLDESVVPAESPVEASIMAIVPVVLPVMSTRPLSGLGSMLSVPPPPVVPVDPAVDPDAPDVVEPEVPDVVEPEEPDEPEVPDIEDPPESPPLPVELSPPAPLDVPFVLPALPDEPVVSEVEDDPHAKATALSDNKRDTDTEGGIFFIAVGPVAQLVNFPAQT